MVAVEGDDGAQVSPEAVSPESVSTKLVLEWSEIELGVPRRPQTRPVRSRLRCREHHQDRQRQPKHSAGAKPRVNQAATRRPWHTVTSGIDKTEVAAHYAVGKDFVIAMVTPCSSALPSCKASRLSAVRCAGGSAVDGERLSSAGAVSVDGEVGVEGNRLVDAVTLHHGPTRAVDEREVLIGEVAADAQRRGEVLGRGRQDLCEPIVDDAADEFIGDAAVRAVAGQQPRFDQHVVSGDESAGVSAQQVPCALVSFVTGGDRSKPST